MTLTEKYIAAWLRKVSHVHVRVDGSTGMRLQTCTYSHTSALVVHSRSIPQHDRFGPGAIRQGITGRSSGR
jgi:hypothetical protein